MGKLSAFWLAGIAASLGASAAAAAPISDEVGNLRLHALPQAQLAKGPMVQSQIAPFRMNAAQKTSAGYARMDNGLARIAEATSAVPREQLMGSLRSTFPHAQFINAVPLSAPLTLVDMHIEAEHQASAMAQLKALGAQHVSAYSNVVSAFIPSDRMKEAANVEGMGSMRLSLARTNTGAVSAQGDIIQSTYALRAPYTSPGYTGAGFTVGVLSDSFACQNQPAVAAGYADDVASGDLPANVNVLEDAPGCGGADEGRAMAQLVYDIAPGVNLAFHTAFAGEADFANGIRDLQRAGANIIVDDVFYYDEPVFQDGMVAKAVNNVHKEGVAYFSSAGNDARQSYEATWVDSGTQGLAGDDNQGEELMAFKVPAVPPLGAPLPATILPAVLPFSGQVVITMQWDQPFVRGAPGSPGASSVMNVCLVDIADPPPSFGHVYPGSCSGHNLLGEDPFVITAVPGPALFGVEVSVAGGTAPSLVKLSFLDDGLNTNALPGYATYSATLFGHTAAAGAASVGASYFRGNPLCNPATYPTFALEQFSSGGGDPILFDTHGNRLASREVRQKPQFVAPDGDNTTFFSFQLGERDSTVPGCANSPTSWNFFGTSSAAPHAAGMAALLWEAAPDMTPDMVVTAMEHSAVRPMLASNWFTYNPNLAPSTTNPAMILQTAVNGDTGWGFLQGFYALPYVLLNANAGSALFVPQGNTVTLDGSGSNIPPDAKPTYIWTQVGGPLNIKLTNTNSAHPSFVPNEPGSYAFVLTIALDNGRVSATSAPVGVTVTGGPGAGGGGAIGLGLLIPGFMAAALRRRRKA